MGSPCKNARPKNANPPYALNALRSPEHAVSREHAGPVRLPCPLVLTVEPSVDKLDKLDKLVRPHG